MAGCVGDLPDPLLAAVFGHLPVKDRVKAGSVCRQWRRASAAPSPAWMEFQWECESLEQLAGLLRWLRPRMPALHCLRLVLRDNALCDSSPRRVNTRIAAVLDTLARRLAAAPQLQDLAVLWDVRGYGGTRSSNLQPLPCAALLPAQSKTARRAHRPLLPQLRRLELGNGSGVALAPALRLLGGLTHLSFSGAHRDYYDADELDGPLEAAPAGTSLADCLPPTLHTLVLDSPKAIGALGMCFGLADHLPCLRELRMPVHPDVEAEGVSVSGPCCRLLETLLPLAGQLQCLELAPKTLPPSLTTYTALTCLVLRQPLIADKEVWQALPNCLRHLHTLDMELVLSPNDDGSFDPLPLAFSDLAPSLRKLRVLTEPAADFGLPAGQHLWGLEKLCLGRRPALRLAPLLPHMPQLQELSIENDSCYGCISTPLAPHPVDATDGGSGTTGTTSSGGTSSSNTADDMYTAAAAAASLKLGTSAEMHAAAGQVASALARHPRFRLLRLLESYSGCLPSSASLMAMRLQRLSRRAEVEVVLFEDDEDDEDGGRRARHGGSRFIRIA